MEKILKTGEKKAQEMAAISGTERKKYVKNMFNGIARHYDLLNHLLSGGIDIYWRKKAISKLKPQAGESILDLACGTGDFAIESKKRADCEVFGADIALEMLKLGSKKAAADSSISFLNADGEQLPLKENCVNGVTIAFGIRNMGTIPNALKEMNRILISGGRTVVLEFSTPTSLIFKKIYLFYFNVILPFIGKLISNDSEAYRYLPESVGNFPAIEDFVKLMEDAGFVNVQYWKLLNGIAVIYRGEKS
jgi:demethylmenaquinone methyltransferase/2-methoxy-6-polyprenyl-1,4-benzoquinol methylase